MKKLTTNQLLMAGGVIAFIYILYKKKKAKNGSEMIKDALNEVEAEDDIADVSVSDGDKGTSEPPKGGMPMPSKPIKFQLPQMRVDNLM